MAVYRQLQVSFWQDEFVLELTPEEKYFYLYLMTNSKTTQCGIYEIAPKVMEMETGYNRETIEKLLARFQDYGKILYSKDNKEILLLNWLKFNPLSNQNIQKCVAKELKGVKTPEFLEILNDLYDLDGLGVPIERGLQGAYKPIPQKEKEKEEEQEQKEEKEKPVHEQIREIVNHLNEKTGKAYKATTAKTRQLVKARLGEGFTVDDFKRVIDRKARDWLKDKKMEPYLRPETLFQAGKFEGYLNEGRKNSGGCEGPGERDPDEAKLWNNYDESFTD